MNCKIYKTLSPGSLTPHTTYLSVSFPFRSLPPLVSFDLTHPIAMPEFPSGCEFCSDPSTAQLFYREPINRVLSPWILLPQSDYHSPRHEIHNLRVPTLLPVCSSHPVSSFKFYDPSFHDSTTILAYSPYPFSYDSSYDTRLWEGRKQQDVYLDPTDNKEHYASRIQDQSRHTWPSPPGSSPLRLLRRPGRHDDPTLA